jgi:hypothetical protein
VSAVNVALIAVGVQRRQIIDRLLEAQADCPERALVPEGLGRTLPDVVRNLRSEGILVATQSGHLYLNRKRLAVATANNRIAVQLIMFVVVAVAVVAGLVALVHAA